MTEPTFYGHTLPKEKSLVRFIFTKRDDNVLHCYLLDYDLKANMPHKYATRKKRVKNLNKIAPLNKELVGFVEDTDNNIILNLAFVDKEEDEYKKFQKTVKENNALSIIVKRYSFKYNMSFKDLWEEMIHPIDIERVENSELSLYQYIKENIEKLELLKSNKQFYNYLKDSIYNRDKNDDNIVTNFGLISVGGIENTKRILRETLEELKYDIDIYLENVPTFKLVSKNKDVTKEQHNIFIDTLQQKIRQIKPSIFLKRF